MSNSLFCRPKCLTLVLTLKLSTLISLPRLTLTIWAEKAALEQMLFRSIFKPKAQFFYVQRLINTLSAEYSSLHFILVLFRNYLDKVLISQTFLSSLFVRNFDQQPFCVKVYVNFFRC